MNLTPFSFRLRFLSIGELWAKISGGKAVYFMAQKVDEQGRNIREQLQHAIR